MKDKALFTQIIFYLFVVSLCASCSYISKGTSDLITEDKPAFQSRSPHAAAEKSPTKAPAKTSKVTIEKLPQEAAAKLSDVEILWQIPDTPVDAFVIYYGKSETDLNQKLRVAVHELQRYEDSQHGFVYRHILKGIPKNQAVYISMATEQRGELSERSPVTQAR